MLKRLLLFLGALIVFSYWGRIKTNDPISHGYLPRISEGQIVSLVNKSECEKYTIVLIERTPGGTELLQPQNDVIHIYLRPLHQNAQYTIGLLNYVEKIPTITSTGEMTSSDLVNKRKDQFNCRQKAFQENIKIPYWIKGEPYFLHSAQIPEKGIAAATYKKENWFSTQWVKQCATNQPPANYEPVFEIEWKTFQRRRILMAFSFSAAVGAYLFYKKTIDSLFS
ncbi:MAG TPA: hypothetical protein VHO47_00895 [Candidatus Babeliales bacterium]|nr:hypothetical protein [Candidatus Babeliales bacterium]